MDSKINFQKFEEEILEMWNTTKAFELSEILAKDRPEYIFYDGPPFATGLPHYGHILSGTIKDTVTRYYYMQGYKVKRRFGWDCHGLPVEYEIDKMLGITTRQEIIAMGIDKYNAKCRSIVLKYTSEWESIVGRTGRWVDFKNGYRTMDMPFMESVWAIFKMFYERDSVYKGYRVMPYSTACSTPLSNFEANQNYKEVSDLSILISFPLKNKIAGRETSLIAWTTTPWTLPSNMALMINKAFLYAIFKHKECFYVMLKSRIDVYFKDAEVIKEIKGSDLELLEYEQPFDYFEGYREKGFFRIYHADFVSDADGTGVVHCAPGFGEEDYKALVNLKLIENNEVVPCPIDEKGKFTSEISKYAGIYVKDADKLILNDIKSKVLMNKREVHRYPFCWRSDTPLLYKTVPNWFIKVKRDIPKLLKYNLEINWVPESVKFKKFQNWLANARDWSISRNRFWGTPIPLWHCNGKYICVGSIKELEDLTGNKIDDLHREYIDDLVIIKDGEEYRRIDEVFDCWFESGSMPYAQQHWPFNGEQPNLPANFIAEGVDQTRGWFYTLHVISSILFDSPPFKNCVVNGIVLAEDGKKMSKRHKNYPDPMLVINKYGADSLRLYLISNPVVMAENLNFSEKGVNEILKVLIIPWYNSYVFYNECANGISSARDNEEELAGEEIEMDSWILHSFDELKYKIDRDLKKYVLANVLGYAVKFVDDLTKWYIRMNRKSLRLGRLATLKHVLMNMSVVMAPFAPFFSEFIYQKMEFGSEFKSVHFVINSASAECPGEHRFGDAKKVIESIRRMKELKNISLKTPTKKISIICSDEFRNSIESYVEVIKAECFVLDVEFLDLLEFTSTVEIKPNFIAISKNNSKEEIKTKIGLINSLEVEEVEILLRELQIIKETVVITKDEVLYKKKINTEKYCESFNNFSIILDTEITEDMIKMRTAREFYSFIQRLRRVGNFNIADNVKICVQNPDLVETVKESYDLEFCKFNDDFVVSDTFTCEKISTKVYLYH